MKEKDDSFCESNQGNGDWRGRKWNEECEGEAGRLTKLTTRCSSQAWVPQKVEKIEWWESENMCQTGGIRNWDILSDEW